MQYAVRLKRFTLLVWIMIWCPLYLHHIGRENGLGKGGAKRHRKVLRDNLRYFEACNSPSRTSWWCKAYIWAYIAANVSKLFREYHHQLDLFRSIRLHKDFVSPLESSAKLWFFDICTKYNCGLASVLHWNYFDGLLSDSIPTDLWPVWRKLEISAISNQNQKVPRLEISNRCGKISSLVQFNFKENGLHWKRLRQ